VPEFGRIQAPAVIISPLKFAIRLPTNPLITTNNATASTRTTPASTVSPIRPLAQAFVTGIVASASDLQATVARTRWDGRDRPGRRRCNTAVCRELPKCADANSIM
jgi:hypothetical protein